MSTQYTELFGKTHLHTVWAEEREQMKTLFSHFELLKAKLFWKCVTSA